MKLWMWWVLVVILVSGPWFGVTREAQWQRVTWIPFHGFEDKPQDIVANFLLFVPFGMSFGASRRGLAGVRAAIGAAFILSLLVEIPQLFYVLRDPSATDVLMAVCGSGAGSFAAQAFHGRDARRAPRGSEARERCSEQ
jgi:glycopeptide antibiotics resistance protein